MAARIRPWLLEHLPAGVLNRPAEWFLAILCLLSGLPILTGLGRTSSVAALLYPPAYYAWGACLVFGGLGMICGLTSIRRRTLDGVTEYVITRVPCYLLGLRLLCIASLVFTIAILIVAHLNGVVAAAVTLAFAGMCGVRILVVGGRHE